MRFPKSKLYESIFTPILIGLLVGFIAAIIKTGIFMSLAAYWGVILVGTFITFN